MSLATAARRSTQSPVEFPLKLADYRRTKGGCVLCAYVNIPCVRVGTKGWSPIQHQDPDGNDCDGHMHLALNPINPGY